ncbi:hypothetical protein [Nocardioides sp. zg-DK7169]|uniref:hypothetical protein n=1 Tax=Nocardioides sp. zg-DK7169 TaxID=2736600 RepID=UPI0015563A2F|nr:hypothetical protein [Nocardioides sp. zg-DK7169]NPC97271.1 hypothetical protein [Nocardioides sp. zg-DK7169]
MDGQEIWRWVFFGTLVGYLAVFQNPALPAALKLLFVLTLVAIGAVAWFSLGDEPARLSILPQLRASIITLALVTYFSAFHLLANDVPLTDWIRDGLNYLLIPASIAVGARAGKVLSHRVVVSLTIISGVVASFSFASSWLSRRTGGSVELPQFGLASSYAALPGIAICLSIYFCSSRHRLVYLILAYLQLGLLLLSGGRTPMLYVAVSLTVCIGFSLIWMRNVVRPVIAGLIGSGALVAILFISDAVGGGVASSRLGWFLDLFAVGSSAITADASANARDTATSWAIGLWDQNLVLGRGLGHTFPHHNVTADSVDNFTLDTPIVVLVKFGILGTLIISICLIRLHRLLYRSATALGPQATAGRLFVVICGSLTVALLFNGFPAENRGYAVMLFLMTALCFSDVPPGSRQEKRG